MNNMFKMMKDAAVMQRNVKKIQAQLRQQTVEFSAKGGQVKATARGDGSLASITIAPEAMDPARPAVLEKMVVAAVEGALDAARKHSAREMRGLMSEMGMDGLPGM
ncbi:MAG: YbaB/EbfC family nucleoid-associated protein [Kiritimatiellia bacterium]|nr:YbaB/EbfC family nucleoid-associated protein [Lentisphaerota bacterium]